MPLAAGQEATCAIVNESLRPEVIHRLADGVTRLIPLRGAFDPLDLAALAALGSSSSSPGTFCGT